jgi:molybdopterin converting factor small subunit
VSPQLPPNTPLTVHVPSPLRSYTAGRSRVAASGPTIAAVLADLDRQFPGMRFRMIDEQDRIRPHIRIFAGEREVRGLDEAVAPADTVHLLCALSGG